jgi:hypothetical protein
VSASIGIVMLLVGFKSRFWESLAEDDAEDNDKNNTENSKLAGNNS